MPKPNFTPEEMQAAVAHYNQMTGRSSPYDQPPAAVQLMGQQGTPVEALENYGRNGGIPVQGIASNVPIQSPADMDQQALSTLGRTLASRPAQASQATAQATPMQGSQAMAGVGGSGGPQQLGSNAGVYPGSSPLAGHGYVQPPLAAAGGQYASQIPDNLPAGSYMAGPGVNGYAQVPNGTALGGTGRSGDPVIDALNRSLGQVNSGDPLQRANGYASAPGLAGMYQQRLQGQLAGENVGIAQRQLALDQAKFGYQTSPQGMKAAFALQHPEILTNPIAAANVEALMNRFGFNQQQGAQAGQGGPMTGPSTPGPSGSPAQGGNAQELALSKLRSLPGGQNLTLPAQGSSFDQAFDYLRSNFGDEGMAQNADTMKAVLASMYGANPGALQQQYGWNSFFDNPTLGGGLRSAITGLSGLVPGGANVYTPEGRDLLNQRQSIPLAEAVNPVTAARNRSIRKVFGLRGGPGG